MLTTSELAVKLGTHERTLANWRVSGSGPRFVKVGTKVRYRRSDVDAWLESRTVDNTTEAAALR
ncbi:MAG: helix-turn-helix domain-containing protein [Actinomycetia bacterium]|nr:helix-turn-helix domain-containing protein [Actinomycetes bacterium]